MDCEEFTRWLADAWGDELPAERRAVFEAHMDACDACRSRFEEGVRALQAMRSLDGPRQVNARREGGRLVIESMQESRLQPTAGRGGRLLRLAASLVLAFTAGYGSHALLMMRDAAGLVSKSPIHEPVTVGHGKPVSTSGHADQSEGVDGGATTLRSALADVYASSAVRSDFAVCLMAMSRAER